VTIPETALIFAGIPAAIYGAIAGLTMLASRPRPRVAPYQLGGRWNHAALLWTAADEAALPAGSTAHGGHHSADAADVIGGRASGRY
jgi:hypothetical protein